MTGMATQLPVLRAYLYLELKLRQMPSPAITGQWKSG